MTPNDMVEPMLRKDIKKHKDDLMKESIDLYDDDIEILSKGESRGFPLKDY